MNHSTAKYRLQNLASHFTHQESTSKAAACQCQLEIHPTNATTTQSSPTPLPTSHHHHHHLPQLNSTAAATSPAYNYEPGRLLLNQVAIITGAGSGIGRAAAILFAHHGAYVCISDLDETAAEGTADFIRNSAGDRCIVVVGDVTAEDFPRRCVEATIAAYGRIDILVPNAGFTWDRTIHKMKNKEWDAMLNVHCTAPFRLIQAASLYMRDVAKKEIEGTLATKKKENYIFLFTN